MTRALGRLDWSGLLCAAFNAVWYGRGVRTFVHALSGNCRILKSHFEHRHLQMGVESWVCRPRSPAANVLAEVNYLIDPIRPPWSTPVERVPGFCYALRRLCWRLRRQPRSK